MQKRMTTDKPTVFVIPHTHWDREWYATFQQFRIRLVHVIDALIDLMLRDPTYTHFNLDAQTVILQDYLEIRPEKRMLLSDLVRTQRLGVGPWYVMPDEFLVSGEALVRNLLLAPDCQRIRTCTESGIYPRHVRAYLPITPDPARIQHSFCHALPWHERR
jgi:alpha-mannosidase